ncbi:hypothetical protein [Paraglaciecola marina]|uniref:hypothetical protein n=1 Tax=Paraglaciecola marina TaxID=2500157 RepID=UPI00105DFCE9|nr:hypothetical protein [Paraglaciecola marina]
MATPIHSKLINKAAREVLKPAGLVRKGQSRIWLDDNKWWLTMIEFQPSSWSKGTYLNVGISWLWYPKDSLSFDIGYRESSFVEFKDEETFLEEVIKLAEKAKDKALTHRHSMSSPELAKEFVLKNTIDDKQNIWACLHKGMACLYASDTSNAKNHLENVMQCKENRDWANSVKGFAQLLLNLKPDEQLFAMQDAIMKSRKLIKLPEIEGLFSNRV